MAFDDDKLTRLLDVGRSLVTELNLEAVLDRILREAREITGAGYVALGVLNEQRNELERFVTLGIDDASRRAIGELPRGRGVLGVLIEDPRPLRLPNVGAHPWSYGFPPSHPEMHGFLGVPIMIREQAWGNLYLTEKRESGEFTDEDEQAIVILAGFAAAAIENARLYQSSEARRVQLERAVRGLEAARDIADAIGATSELDWILELIVKRGRALIDARTVLIMLREADELVVAAGAGETVGAPGRRLPIAGSTSGEVLERRRTERITDVGERLRIAPQELGVQGARTALLVPMVHHGVGVGVLAAFDRGGEDPTFGDADEQLLRTFAASAANAVAISRSVESDRLRSMIEAADAERSRWARELHDETLQTLGGLRVSLSSALRHDDAGATAAALRQAIEDIELGIENLRGIISDLRPSMLDDLGLRPAIEALLERRGTAGLKVSSELEIGGSLQLSRELETVVYRVIQESLTNVVKHADATAVHVAVKRSGDNLVVEVRDNGSGFEIGSPTSGFGLAGMRERVFLAAGVVEVAQASPGTLVRARLPLAAGAAATPASEAPSAGSAANG